ncbi:MAG TPA: type II secretion system F family protein [Labilithrix sp.]|nr:type II secretion system F family protein [Labilithrix sp.]
MIQLSLLRSSFIIGASVASTIFAYGVASAPSRPVNRLGIRGLKRQRALQDSPFAMVEPLVRWVGTRISGLIPDGTYARLDRQLVLAGEYLGLTPEEYIASSILCTVLGLFFGGAYTMTGGAAAGAVVFAAAGSLLTYMQVSRESDRRARDIGRGLPYVVDLLALSMSAGLDFPGAVRQVVVRSSDRADRLTEELERILQELSLGRARKVALENFGNRTGVVAATEFVAAVVQSEQRGNPLAETLTIQAQVSRQRRSMRAEENTARSATMIYLPLALLMISVLLLIGGPLVLKMQSVMGN